MSARYIVIPNTKKLDGHSHVVIDTGNPSENWLYKIGPYVFRGSEEKCKEKAEQRNYEYALSLMTQGTRAARGE